MTKTTYNAKLPKLTTDDLIRDATYVLRSTLHPRTKYAMLDLSAWIWTGRDGKHRLRYLSEGALMAKMVDRRGGYIHEHVVPRKTIIRLLRSIDVPSEESVRDVLEQFSFAALLLKEEDAVVRTGMPAEFHDPQSPHFHDVWLRYRGSPVKIFEVEPDSRKVIKELNLDGR